MQKFIVLLIMIIAGSIINVNSVSALTFKDLPIKQTSSQWEVTIDKEQYNGPKDQKKFQTYSFTVRNLGKDVSDVKIQAFRDIPDSQTRYALFSAPALTSFSKDKSFTQENFMISNNATSLEIELNWTKNGRPVKETFVFAN
jgi:hypothetical protein